jgi:hypothetical protein
MRRLVSMATRRELVMAVKARFSASSRAGKGRILDEFVALTGYHRKHAIRLLATPRAGREQSSGRERIYTVAVREALIVLWEASDRICGKRLKVLIPTLLDALERHGHLRLNLEVRDRLLRVSAATIDRLLSEARRKGRSGRRRSTLSSAVRRAVPVRTFTDWHDPPPGFMEADLVAHSGACASGSFVQTLVLTDVASGWTECVPLLVREQALITEAVSLVRRRLPFPLLGFDTDNDTVFMNETVAGYCAAENIAFTRSRPYRKNDQAFVEQKNGAVVRRLVGYERYEGTAAVRVLQRLYAAARLFGNLFQPSFKLAAKVRDGARVIKRHHGPATPCARLLASSAVGAEQKAALIRLRDEVDPLALLHAIRTAQQDLAGLAGPEGAAGDDDGRVELDTFLRSLRTAWAAGEPRSTHRARPSKRRYWRSRVDPFATTWPIVEGWLEAEPERTSLELLLRLQAEHPGRHPDGQLRTLQRRVKAWRRAKAQQMIFGESLAALPTAVLQTQDSCAR